MKAKRTTQGLVGAFLTLLLLTGCGSQAQESGWATWCPPCRAEMPELNEFAKKHEGEVTFYAVNLQEPKDTVDKFLKDNGFTMPVLLDLKGDAADAYQIRAIPTTYVIDKDGTILLKKIGSATAAELETALKRAAK